MVMCTCQDKISRKANGKKRCITTWQSWLFISMNLPSFSSTQCHKFDTYPSKIFTVFNIHSKNSCFASPSNRKAGIGAFPLALTWSVLWEQCSWRSNLDFKFFLRLLFYIGNGVHDVIKKILLNVHNVQIMPQKMIFPIWLIPEDILLVPVVVLSGTIYADMTITTTFESPVSPKIS